MHPACNVRIVVIAASRIFIMSNVVRNKILYRQNIRPGEIEYPLLGVAYISCPAVVVLIRPVDLVYGFVSLAVEKTAAVIDFIVKSLLIDIRRCDKISVAT